MCQLHGQRWDRAGRPDLHGWLADPPTIKTPPPGVVCAVEHCDLWPQAALPLCHAHANTWKVNGRPAIDVFVRRFDEVTVTAEEIIRLDLLGPQLRLEIQYVLQCRHDQRATKTLPAVVMAVVRALAATGAVSLLDRTEDDWRTGIGRPAPRDSTLRALLIDARRKVVRPRRRRRLGGRVRPRRLAAAPPRVHRQPAARLHRDSRSRGCGAW